MNSDAPKRTWTGNFDGSNITRALGKKWKQFQSSVFLPSGPRSMSNDESLMMHSIRSRMPPQGFEFSAPPTIIDCTRETCFNTGSVQVLFQYIRVILGKHSRQRCIVGLSGGNTPRPVYALLARCAQRVHMNVDWSRVVFILIDERYCLPDRSESNQKMIRHAMHEFFEKLLPTENFIAPDTTIDSVEGCVAEYSQRLLDNDIDHIDIAVLGLGEDGHIASWFPPLSQNMYHDAYDESKIVSHTTTDRFPVKDRITVSMALLCSARHKVFLLNGAEKVQKWRQLLISKNPKDLAKQPVLQILQSEGVTAICRPPFAVEQKITCPEAAATAEEHLTIVVFGSSGDLAKKKTFPALFGLYCDGFLPESCNIIGYARTPMTIDTFWDTHINPGLTTLSTFFGDKCMNQLRCDESFGYIRGFKGLLSYVNGPYNSDESAEEGQPSMKDLASRINEVEAAVRAECDPSQQTKEIRFNRLFYLALPPSVFPGVVKGVKELCWTSTGWNRVIVEKPFGKDTESSNKLSEELASVIEENQTYRIDHYLGKEMALSIMSMRFANVVFAPLWSHHAVSAVKITFKESFGIGGRAGYFNEYGIIRDIMQNHLLQMLTLIAIERPVSLLDDDIRDEKVKVLRQIAPIKICNCILGQYDGYLQEPNVPPKSRTPTFASCVLFIGNERWHDVPFIFKAGKGLETNLMEIRMQLREVPGQLFGEEVPQNEIVVKVQPEEAIYMKISSRSPGQIGTGGLEQSELDLSMRDRFAVERMPDAYERLIFDAIQGNKAGFVRTDELREAWRIFTPLLNEIEAAKVQPIVYPFNSRGPNEAYELSNMFGYVHKPGYVWNKAKK